MIGDIVGLAAQLQSDTLGDLEILVKTEVQPPMVGSTERVSTGHVRREWAQIRESKCGVVEILPGGQYQIRKDIGARSSRTIAAPEAGYCPERRVTWCKLLRKGAIEHSERSTGLCIEDRSNFPASENLLHEAVLILGKRHFVERGNDHPVADVEVSIAPIQPWVKGTEEAQVEVVAAFAEGRAQVINGMRPSVVGGHRQAIILEVPAV